MLVLKHARTTLYLRNILFFALFVLNDFMAKNKLNKEKKANALNGKNIFEYMILIRETERKMLAKILVK